MKMQFLTACAVAALIALGGCASDSDSGMKKESAMKDEKMVKELAFLSGDELAKEFARGSKVCKITFTDGSKAEDFYYKNESAMAGDLDRNIGSETKAGSWKIVGKGFWIRIGTNKKALGDWMNLVKTGKNAYDAYDSAKHKVMSMKC